jgi:hypothetical protein
LTKAPAWRRNFNHGRPKPWPDWKRIGERTSARLFVQGFRGDNNAGHCQAVGMRSVAVLPFFAQAGFAHGSDSGGLESGHQRQCAAIEGIDDAEQRLRCLVRTHLATLLAGECSSPLLINESRALDDAARASIAAAFDRYQLPWQETLDQLAAEGKLKSAAPPVRLMLFGMLNWSGYWYRPDGALSVEALAESAVGMLLN